VRVEGLSMDLLSGEQKVMERPPEEAKRLGNGPVISSFQGEV
jgi:hypothetical protein